VPVNGAAGGALFAADPNRIIRPTQETSAMKQLLVALIAAAFAAGAYAQTPAPKSDSTTKAESMDKGDKKTKKAKTAKKKPAKKAAAKKGEPAMDTKKDTK
jgi:hypothetical protein